jgi:hypothetical protein
MKSVLFGFFIGGVVLLLHGVVETAINDHPIEEAAEYEVSCVDDILTGRFLFIDGQYFRHGATKATWIPLKQCGLEPVEDN